MFIADTSGQAEPISLKQLVTLLQDSPVIEDVAKGIYNENEIHKVSYLLASYAANRNDIIATICQQLQDPKNFQPSNDLQVPTFIVHSDKRITLRLVIWLPWAKRFGKTLFSYEECHDHNFDFWTINFFGSGYRTRLYNYNHNQVFGYNDEIVALESLDEHDLSPGKVMFYQRSKDVHTQYPPDELSVSLNLIVLPEVEPRQYEFYLDDPMRLGEIKGRIKCGRFERYTLQNALFCGLLKFGDEQRHDLVQEVARSNSKDEVRAIAFGTLLEHAFQQNNHDRFCHLATLSANDGSDYVRRWVAKRTSALKKQST